MKNAYFTISMLLACILILCILCIFIINKQNAQFKLVTDYQLEEMQRLKEYCEAENPNKECILMFDYWAVDK